MSSFDIFGLRKGAKDPKDPKDPAEPAASRAPEELDPPASSRARDPRKLWGGLLAADILVIVLCAAVLGGKIYTHMNDDGVPQPPAQAAKKTPPKKRSSPKKTPAKAKRTPPKPKKTPVKPKKSPPKPKVSKKPASKPASTVRKPAAKPAAKANRARRVFFTFVNPKAREVALRGGFLKTSKFKGRKPMAKKGDGTWETDVYLLPGQYKYLYEVVYPDGSEKSTDVKVREVQ